MTVEILAAESTNLFIGSDDAPRQVVRVVPSRHGRHRPEIRRSRPGDGRGFPARAGRTGHRRPARPGRSGPARGRRLGGRREPPRARSLEAEVVVADGCGEARHPFQIVVAEPGWRMFMIPHFHYDPVWWNTQAAYTETWGAAIQYRSPFQEPGLALVASHLEMARRDPDYKFVLAELDYLKPYWDAYPEDREYVRELLGSGRLEFVGGTYNEPNTNLTSAESTIRNAIYGIGYQRDVLGGAPATAWQLDAFGHDPQFPGIMADAGVTSSSWARGPFHEWGPNWVRGPGRMPFAELAASPRPHDAVPDGVRLDRTERSGAADELHGRPLLGRLVDGCRPRRSRRPRRRSTGSSSSSPRWRPRRTSCCRSARTTRRPNKWVTAIQRDWNSRYVWPKFVTAIPREFFDAVRAEKSAERPAVLAADPGHEPDLHRQGRLVHRHQAGPAGRREHAPRSGEVRDAREPARARGSRPRRSTRPGGSSCSAPITTASPAPNRTRSISTCSAAGARRSSSVESALDGALRLPRRSIDTSGDGVAVTVFNALSWPRTDIARVEIDAPGWVGRHRASRRGRRARPVRPRVGRRPGEDGAPSRATIAFVARDVPALGYRTFRIVARRCADRRRGVAPDSTRRPSRTRHTASRSMRPAAARSPASSTSAPGPRFSGPARSGTSCAHTASTRTIPLFGEGPWHLTPDGRFTSAIDFPSEVVVEISPIGQRDPRRGAIRAFPPLPGDHPAGRHRPRRAGDRAARLPLASTASSGSGSRPRARAAGRSPRSATASSAGRSGDRTSTSPWSRSRSTIRPTTGSGSGRPRASRSVSPGSAPSGGASVASHRHRRGRDPRRSGPGRQRSAGWSSRSSARASPRPSRTTTGIATASCISTPTCPTSGSRSAAPPRTTSWPRVLDAADPGYRAELDRQLARAGLGPAVGPRGRRRGTPRGSRSRTSAAPRDLPVLIVAGSGAEATAGRHRCRHCRISTTASISVAQPADLDGATGNVADRTVAILNRGMPSFNVEADGSLYLSIMRSCSGWPSGVWIDPPRRSTPDGANFQFQHWSHRFEYALVASAGDWREAGIVRLGHEYNNPLTTRVLEGHPGALPATAPLVVVEPASAVHDRPQAGRRRRRLAWRRPETDSMRRRRHAPLRVVGPPDAGDDPPGVAGRARPAARTRSKRKRRGRSRRPASSIEVHLDPYEIATVSAALELEDVADAPRGSELGQRAEAAQPVFSDYWLHNKGAAPMGYQPVTVQIRPSFLDGDGPFALPVVVASERTDEAVAGFGRADRPAGLGGLAERADLSARAGCAPRPRRGRSTAGRGRRRAVLRGRPHHRRRGSVPRGCRDHRLSADAATASPRGRHPTALRSSALAWAVERALTTAGIGSDRSVHQRRGGPRPRR